MSAPVPSGPSWTFLVLTFASAVAVGGIVMYLGITGRIGVPIP